MEDQVPFDSEAYHEELIRRAARTEQRRVAALRRQLNLERGVFLTLILVMAVTIWRMAGPREPYAISVNGHRVATVASAAQADGLLADLKRELAGKDLEKFAEFKETVTRTQLTAGHPAEPIVSVGQAADALRKHLHVNIHAYAIFINGKPAVALPTQTLAKRCLEQILTAYARRGRSEPVFRERIEIKPVKTAPRKVFTKLDLAAVALTRGQQQQRSYTVQAGDTGWVIANRFGMTVAELAEANKGANLNRLRIGDVLRLGPGRSMLTVVTTESATRTEPMAFATEVVADPRLEPGERQVLSPGKPGKRIVEYRLTRYNGKEVSREVTDQRIETLPRTERVAVGQ